CLGIDAALAAASSKSKRNRTGSVAYDCASIIALANALLRIAAFWYGTGISLLFGADRVFPGLPDFVFAFLTPLAMKAVRFIDEKSIRLTLQATWSRREASGADGKSPQGSTS